MHRLFTALYATLACLLLLAFYAEPARGRSLRGDEIVIQPLESRSGLVLRSRPGLARVEDRRGSISLSLGAEEELTTIAETAGGWVAAGVRRESDANSVFVVAEESGATRRLPDLRRKRELQLRPVLLIHAGEIVGAAWLEGRDHRSLAVRFAEWNGLAWGRAETVSRPGPGSQTGLTGVTLANGEILLAWSRFDGTDDEVTWSSRRGGEWSRPARLGRNNAVPDVTPVLAASGEGATLVWGRLEDAEYRLIARRFAGGAWTQEQRVGEPGSLYPSLVREGERLFAVYRNATPRGWSVTELAEGAPVVRHAFVEVATASRPVLTASENGARLEWNRPKRSATRNWELRQQP